MASFGSLINKKKKKNKTFADLIGDIKDVSGVELRTPVKPETVSPIQRFVPTDKEQLALGSAVIPNIPKEIKTSLGGFKPVSRQDVSRAREAGRKEEFKASNLGLVAEQKERKESQATSRANMDIIQDQLKAIQRKRTKTPEDFAAIERLKTEFSNEQVKGDPTGRGIIENIPFGKKIVGGADKLFGTDKGLIEQARQTPEFKVGAVGTKLAGTLAQYNLVNKALAGTKIGATIANKLGSTFAGTQAVDFIADRIVQAPNDWGPLIRGEKKFDESMKDLFFTSAIDVGLNALVGSISDAKGLREALQGKEVTNLKNIMNQLGESGEKIVKNRIKQLDPKQAAKVSKALGLVDDVKPLVSDVKVKPLDRKFINPVETTSIKSVASDTGFPVDSAIKETLDVPVDKSFADTINDFSIGASKEVDEGFSTTLKLEDDIVLEKGQKLRKTIHNSLMESELPIEVKDHFIENPAIYNEVKNTVTWDNAFKNVQADADNILGKMYAKTALESADDSAETIALLHKLGNEGNYKETIKLAKNFSEKATEGGRAIQAISLLSKTTPEGKLVDAVKIIEGVKKKLFDDFPDAYKALEEQGKLPEITEADFVFIKSQMEKAQDLTGRARDIEIAKVDQLITDKIPVSIGDKIRAIRNLSLLGNVKTTLTRNPLGNIIFSGLENVAQVPSGITDAMLSKMLKTERQTAIIPSLPNQFRGLKKGFGEAIEDIKLGIDTSPSRGGIELPRSKKVFDKSLATTLNELAGSPVKLNKFFEVSWLNKANNWLGDALKLGDRPFYQAAYEMRLKELQKLQPNADIKQLEKLSQEFALNRVFQNQGTTADILNSIKKGMNKAKVPGVDFGLGDIAMPYTQTPANILEKGLEYTPLNLINIMGKIGASGVGQVGKKLGKPGLMKASKFGVGQNQKAFTDAIGRMFTGTGISALGYTLAKNGFISGKDQTKGKERALGKQVGNQQYSIKIGDTWHSYDWAQPAAIPLAIGVDFYNAGVDEDEFLEKIKKGTVSGGNTLLEQSLLRGLTNLFGGQYSSPAEGLLETVTNLPTQFSPTLGGQAGQFADPFKRDIDYGNVGEILQRKNPLTRQDLPTLIDMFGQPIKEQDDRKGFERLFDVFVNPSRKQQATDDTTTIEIQRLFEATGETDVIPSKLPNSIKDDKILSREFKIQFGQGIKKELDTLFETEFYTNASDENKRKMVRARIDRLYNTTKDNLGL